MSKQRAFVKYTKQGAIIPGSLIVTTKGGYPKDGVYKEIPIDLCCEEEVTCPQYPICQNWLLETTAEDMLNSTGNTGIEYVIAGSNFTTQDSTTYTITVGCQNDGFGTSSGNTGGPLSAISCASSALVFYFKDDEPVFIAPIPTGDC